MGIVLGLVFGWFAITYGFFKALFVALTIGVGYWLGKKVDEQTDWGKLWERLFGDR